MAVKTTKPTEPVTPPTPASIPITPAHMNDSFTSQVLNPQPYITRQVFQLRAVIPTGEYASIQPMIETEYIIPEGAQPLLNIEMMDNLYHDLAISLSPMIVEQIKTISVRGFITQCHEKGVDATSTVAQAFISGSPLFKWLSVVDRPTARKIVQDHIELEFNPST